MLSVIIPNYNHARYLPHAILALRAQERPADEIIVVDDGSADDSLAVLAELGRDRSDLTVIANERNRGALVSLQRGLEAARGRYVYFGAADDAVLPGFFATALAMLTAHPEVGLFCGDAVLVDGETGRVIGHRPAVRPLQSGGVMTADGTARLLRRADNFILTGSAIFRRDLALAKGGFDPRAHSFADGLLARKVALAAGFCYLPRDVAVWNVFDAGLSRSLALDTPRAERALAELPRLIAADEDLPDWYAPLMVRRWRFGSARLALIARPPRRALLRVMGGVGRLDRAMLAIASPALGIAPARWAVLAWLTMRLRPFRVRDVAVTALNRWWKRRYPSLPSPDLIGGSSGPPEQAPRRDRWPGRAGP
jgi:glycosyltransferase involved in cell wall biosynthesis